jgi:hypothetical protein
MRPIVAVVGADKGGVGKTTVSSLLLDYFTINHRQPRAWDTEYRESQGLNQVGVLKRKFPEITNVVDFTKSEGQIDVLDGLRTVPFTLIDIRAGIMQDTLQMLADVGFMEKSKTGEIKIATFHVLDGSVAAFDEIAEAAKLLGAENHYLVRNHHINDRAFGVWDDSKANLASCVLDVPKLDKSAAEAVDAMNCGFEEFTRRTDSDWRRGAVRHWLRRVYAEFDLRGLSAI